MAVKGNQVTVGTSATLLTVPESDNTRGSRVLVQAPAGAALLLGGPDVTAATGFSLAAGQREHFELGYAEALYAVVASGTGVASVLQTGV